MKRKMVLAGTAWAAGLALAALVSSVCAVFVGVLLTAFLFKTVFRFDFRSIVFMLISFSLAFGFYNAYDRLVYKKITSFSESKISYSGTITDMRENASHKYTYFVDGEINSRKNAKLIVYADYYDCEPGDRISFEAVVRLPENTYLFSSKDYYKSKGIYLQTDSAENVTINKSCFSIRKQLFRYRERVCTVIDSSVPAKEGGMLKGMLFGDKSGLETDDKTMLYRTGIGHVTAVSGLHLVLFCTLISFILRRLNIGAVSKFAVSELFMFLFSLCCGMSPSIVRAFVMMTLINLAPLFFRCTDSLNSVFTAVILMTLFNPFIILNQSFLLSVSGALGAGVFAPYMTSGMRTDGIHHRFVKNMIYLLCVSAAVTPMSVLCFGELSLISPFSNLVITPVCMAALLIAMTGSLLIFINPAVLFKISGVICRMVLNISGIIGKNKFVHTKLCGEFVIAVTVAVVIFCVVAWLVFRCRKYSAFSVLVSVVLVFSSAAFYNVFSGKIVKTALLGNNETGVIIISKGNRADVIDITGKSRNSRYAAKYLDSMGITEVNSLLLTKCSYPAMASYNSELSLCSVKNVTVLEDTYVRRGTVICGCEPGYSDFTGWISDYGSYTVSVKGDSVIVDYAGFHFECTDGGDGIRKYNPNTVLYIDDSGKTNFRRLENG